MGPAAPLATVTVTTTVDEVNGNTTTSIAALMSTPGGAGISLREAVIAANNTAGADTIMVPAGTYTLTITGTGEEAAMMGDLDLTDSVTIMGAGAGSTTIQAGTSSPVSPSTCSDCIDRVFDVRERAGSFRFDMILTLT